MTRLGYTGLGINSHYRCSCTGDRYGSHDGWILRGICAGHSRGEYANSTLRTTELVGSTSTSLSPLSRPFVETSYPAVITI